MAGTPRTESLNFAELTDEEKAVLKECRINSVYFRGLPLGVCSVLLLRQAVNAGHFPHIKRFSAMYYTGLFGFGFLAGVSSYKNTCVEKIMKLENSRLADQVRAIQIAGNRRSHWETERVPAHEHQDADLQGRVKPTNRFSVPTQRPPAEGDIPHSDTGSMESSEEAPAPPSLYFDVEKEKENKYTTYSELRKKHRERWTPPGASRSDQVRHRHESASDSKAGSSDDPLSWNFDMSNSSNEGSNQEGQRGNIQPDRPSHRQGPPPRKNKYGDVVEG